VSELSQAQRDVDEARHRVARQRKVIKNLREAGRDTESAKSLLTSMLKTLRTLEEDQQRLEDERYRVS
jgi:hypothetical protein